MKFSQDNLIKLGLGAAGGYFVADFLLPKRGFATHNQHCPSGKYCNGVCCNHITNDMIKQWGPDACVGPCGWDLYQEDKYWTGATSDPHGAIGGVLEGGAKEIAAASPGGGGGGGGDPLGQAGKNITDAFNSSVNFLGHQIPIALLVGGGLVLIILLKR